MADGRQPRAPARVRVAAAGDVHAHPGLEERLAASFSALDVDLVLLAGDLTSTGAVEEAAVLAEAATASPAPVVCVLGNHDYHQDRESQIAAVLEAAGTTVLERGVATVEVHGSSVGVVGAKGFVGGFRESRLPDFGERALRAVYAETGRDVDALDQGLASVADRDLRIVLLHYAPVVETLVGEREAIWTLLGCDRLATPIARHAPDLVLHGHAHAGSPKGAIGSVPVYNVAQPLLDGDFRVFELTAQPRAAPPENRVCPDRELGTEAEMRRDG